MKSKSYILMQIQKIVDTLGRDGSQYVKEIEDKTVYELLVLKKELSLERVPDQEDVTPHHWLRGVHRFDAECSEDGA